MDKNVEKVVAKSADVAGDFVSKKISDFGSRYREPEEEDEEELLNNTKRETQCQGSVSMKKWKKDQKDIYPQV